MSTSVKSFAERRLSVILWVNNDFLTSKINDVIEVHVLDIDYSQKEDVSISGSPDREIFDVAVAVDVGHVSKLVQGRDRVVPCAFQLDSCRMGRRVFGIVVVVGRTLLEIVNKSNN